MIEERLFPLIPEKFLTDVKFRAWHLNVLNVLPTMRVLGLRVGDMRKVAKELVKENNPLAYISKFAQTYAKDRDALCYEEVMIWGMMINSVKCTDEERIQLLRDFVPAIDNWSVCDTFCNDAKWTKNLSKEKVWEIIELYIQSAREFEVRFAVVMVMWYLLEDCELQKVFSLLEQIEFEKLESEYKMPLHAYYAKMSVAWLLATALSKFPEQTRVFVRKTNLPEDVIKLYVRKARESFRTREVEAL